MFGIFWSLINHRDLDQTIESMNKSTREWTASAARGECYWVCADCGCGFPEGMPDECAYGNSACTDIIKRDKMEFKSQIRDSNND